MSLPQDEFETQFRQYRESLKQEIQRFFSAVAVFRRINDRKQDHLAELNLAPAFFNTVEDALLTTIVLWADKLFDEAGKRGLFNFLVLIEYNCKWMTAKQLQRRKGYPDDHWMMQNRKVITPVSVEADRDAIRNLPALKSFKIRRDKYHGHFDKEYFFDRSRLHEEAPLSWADLEEAKKVMIQLLNGYSADFDGAMFMGDAFNITDLDRLLQVARKGRAVR